MAPYSFLIVLLTFALVGFFGIYPFYGAPFLPSIPFPSFLGC